MRDFLKSFKWSMLVMGIISLITGILILRNPHTAVETIIRIIGYILIAAGISAVLGYLFDKNKGLSSYGDIIIGVMILAIGLVLAFSPGTFIGFVGWIFSIILAIHGISDIIEGVSSKKYDDLKWTHTLLMGLICIGFAAVIFWNPFSTVSSLMILVAVALIIDGLMSILIAGRVGVVRSRYVKRKSHVGEGADAADVTQTPSMSQSETMQSETTQSEIAQSDQAPAQGHVMTYVPVSAAPDDDATQTDKHSQPEDASTEDTAKDDPFTVADDKKTESCDE